MVRMVRARRTCRNGMFKYMKVLHLLTSGETGGIERLCYDISHYGKESHTFCFLKKGGCLYEEMLKEGKDVINLAEYGKGFNIGKLRVLIRYAQQYDVIIVHHGDPILKLYYILTKLITHKCGVTMVHSCYDDESQIKYKGMKLRISDAIFQKCFDVSDGVWFVSEAGRKSCRNRYRLNESVCRVIYNGISPELLEKAKENKIRSNGIYSITYIGRLVPEKGVELLIDAFGSIANKYHTKLSIVGDGDSRDSLEEQVEKKNLSEKVTFYGQQSDVSHFLEQTDIFVYPSVCQEVFGISLVEAMSYGIPCIANAVGGIPEIIDNGIDGFLTQESTSEEISDLIEKVIRLCENGKIDEISENAKKKASRFSICHSCKMIEEEATRLYERKSRENN